MLCLTDQLGHGAHWAVNTPGTWFIEDHGDQPQYSGGEHHTVKTEGKLGNPERNGGDVVCPIPGEADGPEQGDDLTQIFCAGKYQPGIEQHLEKHDEEKDKESIPERLGAQKGRNILLSGKFAAFSQHIE